MVGEVKKTEGSGLRFYMGCSRATSLRDDILVKNKGINGVRYWEKGFPDKGNIRAKALNTREKALQLGRESSRQYGQRDNWEGGEKSYKV